MFGLGQDLSSCRNLMQSLRNEGGEQDKDEANEQSDLEEEKELRIPARSRSKSMSEGDEEEEGPHYHGNIDIGLPGMDVEIGSDRVDIEANIGQQGKRER